jgi:hypothetical protein
MMEGGYDETGAAAEQGLETRHVSSPWYVFFSSFFSLIILITFNFVFYYLGAKRKRHDGQGSTHLEPR